MFQCSIHSLFKCVVWDFAYVIAFDGHLLHITNLFLTELTIN